MQFFIKQIQVNQILHLNGFTINLGDSPKHLLITGPNGSGKTQLINAIGKHLLLICNDSVGKRFNYDKNAKQLTNLLEAATDDHSRIIAKRQLSFFEEQKKMYFGEVQIDFTDALAMTDAYGKNEFILAFYETFRNPKFREVHSIEKPDLSKPIDFSHNKVDEFLKFLADNKVQAALARNEGNTQDVENINNWFDSFQDVLRNLFNDSKLKLNFDYKDYSFYIKSFDKTFKFTQLSAGYAAALDIVADLILRMQLPGSLVRAYDMPGIVLIDEPETHLHLALQRKIMPILTKLFPNIQFIVATHSPFILSSLPNAVAYDLEHREVVDDLTDYSYNALAEGYFGVPTESGVLKERLDRMESLVLKDSLDSSERVELEKLFEEFSGLSEAAAPAVKGRFLELKRLHYQRRNGDDSST